MEQLILTYVDGILAVCTASLMTMLILEEHLKQSACFVGTLHLQRLPHALVHVQFFSRVMASNCNLIGDSEPSIKIERTADHRCHNQHIAQ